MSTKFNNALRSAIICVGATRNEIVNETGVGRTTLYKIMSGKSKQRLYPYTARTLVSYVVDDINNKIERKQREIEQFHEIRNAVFDEYVAAYRLEADK